MLPWNDTVCTDITSQVRRRLRLERCECKSIMAPALMLYNGCGHVICRMESHWGYRVDTDPPLIFTRHARQAIIPSLERVRESVERTCERVSSLVLCENSSGEEIKQTSFFQGMN